MNSGASWHWIQIMENWCSCYCRTCTLSWKDGLAEKLVEPWQGCEVEHCSCQLSLDAWADKNRTANTDKTNMLDWKKLNRNSCGHSVEQWSGRTEISAGQQRSGQAEALRGILQAEQGGNRPARTAWSCCKRKRSGRLKGLSKLAVVVLFGDGRSMAAHTHRW
jgi:hypothetical protein